MSMFWRYDVSTNISSSCDTSYPLISYHILPIYLPIFIKFLDAWPSRPVHLRSLQHRAERTFSKVVYPQDGFVVDTTLSSPWLGSWCPTSNPLFSRCFLGVTTTNPRYTLFIIILLFCGQSMILIIFLLYGYGLFGLPGTCVRVIFFAWKRNLFSQHFPRRLCDAQGIFRESFWLTCFRELPGKTIFCFSGLDRYFRKRYVLRANCIQPHLCQEKNIPFRRIVMECSICWLHICGYCE